MNKVYIVKEHISDHQCGEEDNVLTVFASREGALAFIKDVVEKDVLNKDFFMYGDFEEDLCVGDHVYWGENDKDEENFIDLEKGYVHLYCGGNGNVYDLEIIEQEVRE